MKIDFQRTGGFTGIPLTASFDTDKLPPSEAQQLRQLIEQASFFELPERIPAPSEGADRFQYVITVAAEDKRHTVEASEGAVPEDLGPLVEHLMALARARR